jgi:hypothetical protein
VQEWKKDPNPIEESKTPPKNTIKRIMTGVSEGWKLETLPANKLKFHEHPFTRIFRVLGGICIILIITKRVLALPPFFFYLVIIIGFMHMVYIIYIAISSLIHLRGLYLNGKLEVRN